jgi:hypothetical protein
MLQCDKLMILELGERREVLEKSGLCTFCLKHAAELECYGRGGMSKPRCTQAGCDGEHTPSVHKLMGEESVGVNLIAEDESELGKDEDQGEDEDEDEGWWVGTVGAEEMQDQEEEEGTLDEAIESEPEEGIRCTRAQNGSRLEREPSGNHPADELMESGWWSPESPQPYSVEDRAGAQHPAQERGPRSRGEQLPHNKVMHSRMEKNAASDVPWRRQLPCCVSIKRRRLRKRPERIRDQEWEEARQDAWLRQMLSDTSSGEDKESCGRFAESGRWMSKLFKISQHSAATSGGECSGQKKPDYS